MAYPLFKDEVLNNLQIIMILVKDIKGLKLANKNIKKASMKKSIGAFWVFVNSGSSPKELKQYSFIPVVRYSQYKR